MRKLILLLMVLLVALPVMAQDETDDEDACETEVAAVNDLLARAQGALSDGADFQTALDLLREAETQLLTASQHCGESLLLDATFTSEETGISFNYPSVWLVDGSASDIAAIATSEEAMDVLLGPTPEMPEGGFGMGITTFEDMFFAPDETEDIEDVVESLVEVIDIDDTFEVSDSIDFTVNDRRAIRTDVSTDMVTVALSVVEVESDYYVVIIAGAHPGEMEQFAPTMIAVIETIRVE